MNLATLTRLGEAAARLARCFQSVTWDGLLRDLAPPFEVLIHTHGDRQKVAMPPSLSLGAGMHSAGADEWRTEIWTREEAGWLEHGAGWCFVGGRRRGYEDQGEQFYERARQLGLNPTGHYLELELRAASDDDAFPRILVRLSETGAEMSLYRLMGWSASRLRRAERRNLLQSLDALTSGVEASVDLSWSPKHVGDSVMAQIVSWYARIEGRKYAENQPALSEDAYYWLVRYAARIAGRRPSALAMSDVYDVARRSVRPPSAAAHHTYWRKSARYHPENGLADRAAACAGVSRRTVFARLKNAGKTLADFADKPNPEDALHVWLQESSPAGRLPAASKKLINILVETGMCSESARKFERRVRGLAPDERHRRIQRALGRRR